MGLNLILGSHRSKETPCVLDWRMEWGEATVAQPHQAGDANQDAFAIRGNNAYYRLVSLILWDSWG